MTQSTPSTPGDDAAAAEDQCLDALACAYRNYAIFGCDVLPSWGDIPEIDRRHYRDVVLKMLALSARHNAALAAKGTT